MLAIQTIREQEAKDKWQKLIAAFDLKRQEQQTNINHHKVLRWCHEKILNDIKQVEHIENLLFSNQQELELASKIKDRLIIKRDRIRIHVSLNILKYLLPISEIKIEENVRLFFIGIDSISASLIYLEERINFFIVQDIEFYKNQIFIFLQEWVNISKKIQFNSVFERHENSLKLIYASLYILERAYNDREIEKKQQEIPNNNVNFLKEEERYNELLEDMENWSQEDWTEEEQKAFERAMSNLN